jgi:hypothetical protein
MKRIHLIVALLAFVLVSTTAMAEIANKELCLSATSSNAPVTSSHTLSYTGLSNGHVLFYGDSCYVIPPMEGITGSKDCLPVSGTGILYESKLEIAVQGVEYMTDLGVGVFTSGQTHFWLSTDTLTGTYTSLAANYVGGQGFQEFDSGTVTAVKCHAVSKSETDADKQFDKFIKRIDMLGTE